MKKILLTMLLKAVLAATVFAQTKIKGDPSSLNGLIDNLKQIGFKYQHTNKQDTNRYFAICNV